MPRETANAVPSRIPALDGTAQRLLACWDAHLAARGVIHPEAEDFEAFGSLIGSVEVERWRNDLITQGQHGEDGFDATGSAKQMPRAGFGRGDRYARATAEHGADGRQLATVAHWR